MANLYMELYRGFMADAVIFRKLWKECGGAYFKSLADEAFRHALVCKSDALRCS